MKIEIKDNDCVLIFNDKYEAVSITKGILTAIDAHRMEKKETYLKIKDFLSHIEEKTIPAKDGDSFSEHFVYLDKSDAESFIFLMSMGFIKTLDTNMALSEQLEELSYMEDDEESYAPLQRMSRRVLFS